MRLTCGGTPNTSFQQNPTSTFPTGSYIICLTISDSTQSCQDTFCDTINVVNNANGVNELSLIASSLENHPNPFNGNTTISYMLKQDAAIELSVVDILGKKVATIEKENKTSGKHSIVWNAENMSQGIYFIQLKAGNQLSNKKIVITK